MFPFWADAFKLCTELRTNLFFLDEKQKHCAFEPRHDKTNKAAVRPAKTQISLGIRPVWSESSLCAKWVATDPSFLYADSEYSSQTGRMSRLIWVFAGRTTILLVLSCRGSFMINAVIHADDRCHRDLWRDPLNATIKAHIIPMHGHQTLSIIVKDNAGLWRRGHIYYKIKRGLPLTLYM